MKGDVPCGLEMTAPKLLSIKVTDDHGATPS